MVIAKNSKLFRYLNVHFAVLITVNSIYMCTSFLFLILKGKFLM